MINPVSNEPLCPKGARRDGKGRWSLLLVAPLLILTLSAAPANAEVSCHQVNARGTGHFAPPEPDDPANLLRTTVQIQGGGLLQGSTRSELLNTFTPPATILLQGDITFTTNRATLTVTVGGWFSLATGEFRVAGPVTDASGKLQGASGALTLQGAQEDLEDPTGAFTETVVGGICVDLG